MKLITKITSSFQHKCPQCLEGDMFIDRNPYHLKTMSKMYSHCPNCGLNFEPEPGYYYGAMYVSYALGIAFGVAAFIITYFFVGEKNLVNNFIAIIITLIVFMPVIMRLSRNIWINMFMSYDKDWKQHKGEKKATLR